MHFGVREHAMGAIANGMALHGGAIPYTATFLTFSDYMRPAIRLGALMEQRVVYIFTHDSIGMGEGRPDTPTHRAAYGSAGHPPTSSSFVPRTAAETVQAWTAALERRHGPDGPGTQPPEPAAAPWGCRFGLARDRSGHCPQRSARGVRPLGGIASTSSRRI